MRDERGGDTCLAKAKNATERCQTEVYVYEIVPIVVVSLVIRD